MESPVSYGSEWAHIMDRCRRRGVEHREQEGVMRRAYTLDSEESYRHVLVCS